GHDENTESCGTVAKVEIAVDNNSHGISRRHCGRQAFFISGSSEDGVGVLRDCLNQSIETAGGLQIGRHTAQVDDVGRLIARTRIRSLVGIGRDAIGVTNAVNGRNGATLVVPVLLELRRSWTGKANVVDAAAE